MCRREGLEDIQEWMKLMQRVRGEGFGYFARCLNEVSVHKFVMFPRIDLTFTLCWAITRNIARTVQQPLHAC